MVLAFQLLPDFGGFLRRWARDVERALERVGPFPCC